VRRAFERVEGPFEFDREQYLEALMATSSE
jgi:hypothetical protein